MTVQLSGGQSVKLFYDPRSHVSVGDNVELAVTPGTVCLFDDTGKKVLQW